MPRTGLGVNPLVLNFRGNALSQLGRFREALQDYREATEIFRKAEILKSFRVDRVMLGEAGSVQEPISLVNL